MKTGIMGLTLSLAAASVLALTGCGSSSSTPEAAVAYNGVFVDSAVANVDFVCGTVSGTTDADGNFGTCPAGSTVTFSIGGLVLGSSTATGDGVFFITDIVGTTRTDISDEEVLKIAVLLQSLDTDGDPSNGITIAPEAAAIVDAIVSDGGDISDFTIGQVDQLVGATIAALVIEYDEYTLDDFNTVTIDEAEANLADTLEVIDTFTPPPVTGAS